MATGRKRNRTGQQLETWDTPRVEEMVDIQQEADSGEVTPNGGKGKKRGKTTLQVIPTGESQRQTIEWNERGQPVGPQSVKFSSAVGCIVREQVPINVKDWRLVRDKPKNEVWGLLLQQYKVEEIHKTYIFQQMGRLWRAYKNELTNTVLATLDSHRSWRESARLIGSIRPVCVPQNEWDEFVAERSSPEWRVKRGKMEEVRAKQLLPHTLSRKGYARKEYEHAELKAKLASESPAEGPIPIKHDVLSQVLGKEKNGRVRGMGADVTPSRVDGQLQNAASLQAFQDKLDATCERTKRLEEMFLQLTNKHTGNASDAASKHTTSHANTEDGRVNGERRSTTGPLTGNSKSVQASNLGLNQPCNILSWMGTDEVVAKGRVSAVDPSSKVHGYVLGPDCYRIEVEEAVNPRAEFYRFQPEFSVVEDAVGSTIAWLVKYIMPRT